MEEVAERATPHALVTQGLRVPQQGKLRQTDPEAKLANDFVVSRNCNFMLMRPCLH